MGNTWVGVLLVVLIIGLAFLFLCVHISTPEQGEHTGYITEAGYRGLIWETHYIKVVDAHFATYSGDGADQGWWYYGVNESDLTVFDNAQEFQKNNSLVTVSYKCDLIVGFWERSEGCMITNIRASA